MEKNSNNEEVVLKLHSFHGSVFLRGRIDEFVENAVYDLESRGINFNCRIPKMGAGLATFMNKAKKAGNKMAFMNGLEWFSYVPVKVARRMQEAGIKFEDPNYC